MDAAAVAEQTGRTDATGAGSPVAMPDVAVVIVTWNRREDVSRAVEALSRQDVDRSHLDVIVVDNASEDGTLEDLRERWRPERIVQNPTPRAHEPAFALQGSDTGVRNAGGFRSLTVIRNQDNLGGCGGFNTGLSYVADVLDAPAGQASSPSKHRPDYVWLVDDDIDLPPDALRRLLEAMRRDERIGLVGSRTCDINERDRTIESTIYLDPDTGLMSDEPSPVHPLAASHAEWAREVGGTRGYGAYRGVREVDVVSAASLLARWSGVREVGLWDHRYFIYCDDADWCRRFATAGYRVVLNLDAVVFHTPWHLKLTPARLYYAQRNLLWMLQKALPRERLRRVMARRVGQLLRDSLRAEIHRRHGHAEIIRRSVHDAATGRGGKLDFAPKPAQDVIAALEAAGALRREARVLTVCTRPSHVARATELRALVRERLADGGRPTDEPRWVEMVRNTVRGAHDEPADERAERIVYAPHKASRLRRQIPLLTDPPTVVVVFGNDNDVPVIRGICNLHIEDRPDAVERAVLERQGPRERLRFIARWGATALLALWWLARLAPYRSSGRYG